MPKSFVELTRSIRQNEEKSSVICVVNDGGPNTSSLVLSKFTVCNYSYIIGSGPGLAADGNNVEYYTFGGWLE